MAQFVFNMVNVHVDGEEEEEESNDSNGSRKGSAMDGT